MKPPSPWKPILIVACVMGAVIALVAQQPIQLQTYNGGGAVALGHGTAATALRVELPTDGTGLVSTNGASVNGVALGSPSAYGTSPGAVNVPGVNSFVTNTVAVSFGPSSSSGAALSLFHASSAAAANVKASAGNLYGLALGNSGTIPCWLQVFNNAGTPTAGTSVIDSYMVQAGTSLVIPAVIALKNYATGIAIAGATADSGGTTTGCTTTFSVTAYYF